MYKKIRLTLLLLFIFCVNGAFGQLELIDKSGCVGLLSDVILVMDVNGIISMSRRPDRISDYKPLMSFKGLWKMITILPSVFSKFDEIKKMGLDIAATTLGNANIVHQLISDLNKKGYGNLASLENDIIKLTVLDEPLTENIEKFRWLKSMGLKMVLATDQDSVHHHFYTERMRKKGIDLNGLFDGVIAHKYRFQTNINPVGIEVVLGKKESGYPVQLESILKKNFDTKGKNIIYLATENLSHFDTSKFFNAVIFDDMEHFIKKLSASSQKELAISTPASVEGKIRQSKYKPSRVGRSKNYSAA